MVVDSSGDSNAVACTHTCTGLVSIHVMSRVAFEVIIELKTKPTINNNNLCHKLLLSVVVVNLNPAIVTEGESVEVCLTLFDEGETLSRRESVTLTTNNSQADTNVIGENLCTRMGTS